MLDFHRRVRDGFAELCKTSNGRIVRIEGNASVEAVFGAIRETLSARLATRFNARAGTA